jgi:hypothetical protein
MSYEFIKLSEVEKVDTSYNASLLIEQNGEIKRLSTDNINFGGSGNQVQADWNETDDTSPAFIANKPSFNGERYSFSIASGGVYYNGSRQTLDTIKRWYDEGADMIVNHNYAEAKVLKTKFNTSSGTIYQIDLTYIDNTGTIVTESVT